MANPSQLYLLADHIKLSLLERQRALSLNLEPNSQDGHISKSLDQMREGIEAIEREYQQSEEVGELSVFFSHTQPSLLTYPPENNPPTFETQHNNSAPNTIASPPNSAASARPIPRRDTRPQVPSSSSFRRAANNTSSGLSKSVRFHDRPTPDPEDEANRAALFPYRDEPEGPSDQSQLDNQQIHAYHKDILRQQDDQLDRLGESIGRQRDLSIQIGDELDDHVQMLDEVEGHMDRHQSRLDGARNQLGNVARRARDNKQLTIILILVVILILLIIILKN
ncbi:MAG: hypothetical protein Q9163_001784 [Psora crenata]